jgi:hypothetical protein
MAAYTGIQGQNILIVSSDPSNPTEGQIWYNSTSNLLKGYANVVTNAWASGGSLNTGRRVMGAAGTQTSALAFGGLLPNDAASAATELYNGTSWTSNPTGLNTARLGQGSASAGTQTSTLSFGGNPGSPSPPGNTAATESWGGSTWTNVPATLNTARKQGGSCGTQTAALFFTGGSWTPAEPGTTSLTTGTEKYDGTSWTTSGNMSTARSGIGPATAGSQTAALGFGGYVPAPTSWSSATESFNGTSWTTLNSLNTARRNLSGAGTQTAALAFAGLSSGDTNTGATELWNGTSWTTNPNSMATARHSIGGTGTQTAALAIGGGPTGASVEEWTGTALATRTLTTS